MARTGGDGRPRRRGPLWWRTSRRTVLAALAIGLVLCTAGFWFGLRHRHDEAAFLARHVSARAVIDKVYVTAPSQGYQPPGFSEYGAIHFSARGKAVRARLLLENCGGTCVAKYRVGQVITVDYDPANLSRVVLHTPAHGLTIKYVSILLFFEFFGALSLLVAAWEMRGL